MNEEDILKMKEIFVDCANEIVEKTTMAYINRQLNGLFNRVDKMTVELTELKTEQKLLNKDVRGNGVKGLIGQFEDIKLDLNSLKKDLDISLEKQNNKIIDNKDKLTRIFSYGIAVSCLLTFIATTLSIVKLL